jgi:putative hydrolase of the HAD superfamily
MTGALDVPATLDTAAIEALLIDLDGVLRRWTAPAGAAGTDPFGLPSGAVVAVAFEADLLEAAMLGRITDETWRRVTNERVLARHGPAGAGAVAAWSASAGTVDPYVLALVRAVRARPAPVVLVTNATTRLEADLERLGLADVFDAVVSSARVGARKPDRAIFEVALARAGVPPARTLFVDDTPGHVVAARTLGLHGHLFVDAANLASALRRAGLLPAVPSY